MNDCILFITPQLPYPPHQGTTIRNYGLISALAARGHSLALLSFLEPEQPAPEFTPLAELCDPLITLPAPQRTQTRRLGDLLTGHPDMARRLWSPNFLAALRNLLARETFDVIQFEGLEMMAYLHPLWKVLLEATPNTLLIYDAHNAEYALQERIARQDLRRPARWPQGIYSAIQANRLARFESLACLMADDVLACSEADAEKLRRLGQNTPVTVIPNAIQVAAYRDAAAEDIDLPHPLMVFTGKMDFRPNVDAVLWFAEEILPLIQAQKRGAHFAIVGQKPHRRLNILRTRPGVTITGEVPEIQPYIHAADVYVAPLRMGSGTRLKLLEALAMSRPVVATTLGAEGIAAEDGEHLLLADTPEAFAEAVLKLLDDPALGQRLGEAGAALVSAQYDWPAIVPRLEAVYNGG